MAATRTARKTTAPVAAPDPVEDEFEDFEETEDEDVAAETGEDDLDELEEVEEETPAAKPTKTRATKDKTARAAKVPAHPAVEFGSPWLAEHVTEVTGENYDGRGIRMLLRKLAKDGKLARVVGEDRARYSFTGPEDETVKLVVTMVKDGSAKELRQSGLQAVKDKADAKKAAAKAEKAAAAAAAAEVEEMEEVEVEDEVEAKPVTRRRTVPKASTTPAAPAKATPSTRRKTVTSAK
jgi:hypothetical protein